MMTLQESILAYYRMHLSQESPVTKEVIRKEVERGPFSLDDEQKNQLVQALESSFDIEQKIGSAVKSDHRPWLRKRKAQNEVDFYYWNRLRNYYLSEDVLPPQVVATLDHVTDEILDYSGDPAEDAQWSRRGMVMGHVQSGKTTNYASLICKAADAGYKIIILLTGTTNSLRQQTQIRLEETFIGKKSLFNEAAQEVLPIIRHATEKRFPAYGTSRDRDFSKVAAQTHGVTLSSLKEPIIFVTKKNKSTLERLRDWLKQQNHGDAIRDPLLLIDDEADNASINTAANPDRTTAINKVIREILTLFQRSTYIGYTATPFANIFIDPDTEDEMVGDDLFPRNFIKALDPPTNYVGATRVFSERGDLKDQMVRLIDDYPDVIPLKHKKDLVLDTLPPSLHHAIRVFILARSIRFIRGDLYQHCSMMVNISRFNDVQDRIYGLIYEYVDTLRKAIITSAGLGAAAIRDPDIATLKADFEVEFSDIDVAWPEVQRVLSDAVSTIEVRTVNMRGGGLDYSQYTDVGLNVIAVGGLALSRGLTLEGLLVSYILRNASASDTLMQMARWFGYRSRYEDICRLYLPEESAGHYEFITEAIEELRSEVKRMQAANRTPQEFGLRVRHDPAAIRITAQKKMKTAERMRLAQDYSGRHVEGYALANRKEVNERNRAEIVKFLAGLGESEGDERTELLWRRVSGKEVSSLVAACEFPEGAHPDLAPISGLRSLFGDYVADRLNAECKEWDVALPIAGSKGVPQPGILEGKCIKIRRRGHGQIRNGGAYVVTGKNKVANPGDEKIGLTRDEVASAERLVEEENLSANRAFSKVRVRPLLIVHVFEGAVAEGQPALQLENPIVSLSFCMPETRVPPEEREYQVNRVFMRQLQGLSEDADDDAEALAGEEYG